MDEGMEAGLLVMQRSVISYSFVIETLELVAFARHLVSSSTGQEHEGVMDPLVPWMWV